MQVQPEHHGEGGTREVWENRDNGGNVAMCVYVWRAIWIHRSRAGPRRRRGGGGVGGVSRVNLAVNRGAFGFTAGSTSQPGANNCLVLLRTIRVYCEDERNVSPLTVLFIHQACEDFLCAFSKGKFGFNLHYPPHPFLI